MVRHEPWTGLFPEVFTSMQRGCWQLVVSTTPLTYLWNRHAKYCNSRVVYPAKSCDSIGAARAHPHRHCVGTGVPRQGVPPAGTKPWCVLPQHLLGLPLRPLISGLAWRESAVAHITGVAADRACPSAERLVMDDRHQRRTETGLMSARQLLRWLAISLRQICGIGYVHHLINQETPPHVSSLELQLSKHG